MFQDIFSTLQTGYFFATLRFLWGSAPLWLPILLLLVFAEIWIKYARMRSIVKNGGILLEIKLPRDVFKTPLAMEIIITSLYQAGKAEFTDTFFEGKHRPWFTFELVSIEGEVRFFVWSQPKFRQLIESQFYAQYPGVEITEVEDYTKQVFIDPEKISLVGLVFKLTKDDVYPIKTYVDYGLDREQEEESKTDPITSTLEFLGSIKAGEQVWLQILFQAHRKNTFKDDVVFPTKPDWKDAGKKEIKKLIEDISGGDDEDGVRRAPTMGEKETIAALERSLAKLPFEVGIRGFYIARKEAFDSVGIAGLIGSLRQYGSETLNGFKIAKGTKPDQVWMNFRGHEQAENERKLLSAYKLRSFFQVPYKNLFTKPFILTTEELATIFHLPGRVAGTPTITKIPSRKSEAPSNLPI